MVSRTQGAAAARKIAATGQEASDRPARTGWIAAGGFLGALAASSCCILPLILFSLGVSGAWVGNLTSLAPYKPVFVVIALGFLGWGYWRVYKAPEPCADGAACASPVPDRFVKSALWVSTGLVLAALFWNWIAPVVAPILLRL